MGSDVRERRCGSVPVLPCSFLPDEPTPSALSEVARKAPSVPAKPEMGCVDGRDGATFWAVNFSRRFPGSLEVHQPGLLPFFPRAGGRAGHTELAAPNAVRVLSLAACLPFA